MPGAWSNRLWRLETVLVAALSFAGGTAEPDTACVRACVQAYLGAGGQLQPPDLLDTAAIHQESLSWLWLNADRCLGRRMRDPTDQQPDQQLAQRLAPSSSAHSPWRWRPLIAGRAGCFSRRGGQIDTMQGD